MPHANDDEDWSDEDEDLLEDVETSVQLGLPDGPIDSLSDILDAAVSRIGGRPAFLTQHPPLDCAKCKNCSNLMELLVQLWCPFEGSPNDRAMYVWGCPRSACQKKQGSVRAWRGLRFNEKYAAKLQKKTAQQKRVDAANAKAAADAAARKTAAKVNPFSAKGAVTPASSSPFGLGAHIFGAPLSNTPPEGDGLGADTAQPAASGDDSGESDESSDDELVTAMASVTLESSDWGASPAYSPIYLSTVAEYLPPVPKKAAKLDQGAVADEDDERIGKSAWGMEGYENSMNLDHVFERFTRRVGYQGEQCIRYELGGTPLPYGGDAVFDRLFRAPPAPSLPVTRAVFEVLPPAAKRSYSPSSIPVCPVCRGERVFECQLMPNLISVLETSAVEKGGKKKALTDEERRKEIERVLKGGGGSDARGMQWGTCMIFSCGKDCCVEGGSTTRSCWREEVVLVQWDV